MCNCSKFFTGKNCDLRLLVTSEIPELIKGVRHSLKIEIESRIASESDLTIAVSSTASSNMLQCSTGGGPVVVASSCPIMLSDAENSGSVDLLPFSPGLHFIRIHVTGNGAANIIPPDPIPVIVKGSGTISDPPKLYFNEYTYLQQGCCIASENDPQNFPLICSNNARPSLLSTSCWDVYTTTGIVFMSLNNFSIPLSVSGLRMDKSSIELPTQASCGPNDCQNCDTYYKTSSDDTSDFTSRQTLSVAFINNTGRQLLPQWIHLDVVTGLDDPFQKLSVSDYRVEVTADSNVFNVSGCESLIIDTKGSYFAVLQHDGALNMTLQLNHLDFQKETLLPTSEGSYCIAINLCLGEFSPVYVGIPEVAQKSFKEIRFIKEYVQRGWAMKFHSIIIRRHSASSLLNFVHYWNGQNIYSLSKTIANNVKLYVDIGGLFEQDHIIVSFNLSGNASYNYRSGNFEVTDSHTFCYKFYLFRILKHLYMVNGL